MKTYFLLSDDFKVNQSINFFVFLCSFYRVDRHNHCHSVKSSINYECEKMYTFMFDHGYLAPVFVAKMLICLSMKFTCRWCGINIMNVLQ